MNLDRHRLVRTLLQARSTSALASGLTTGLASARSVVLARVWVTSEASNALELIGSAGTPSGGGSYGRLDGEFSEMAVGRGHVAAIAAARAPFIVRGIRGDEAWLTNPGWAARQGVRAFVGLPLIVEDAAIGVLAVFDREMPGDDLVLELQLIADIAAVRILDLRARGAPRVVEEPISRRTDEPAVVMTRDDVRRIERENIEAALARTHGKVFGVDGAAALLRMKPTTLASRIKALRIR